MTAAWRARWQSRPPRERQAWVATLVLVAAALYVVLVGSALQSRDPLRRDVEALRAAAAQMDRQARELAQLRAAPPLAVPTGELRDRVQSSLDDARLSGEGAKLDAPDRDHVVVVFDAVAFGDWLRWLESLAARQLRLESCRIDALPASGTVSVTATLAGTGSP